MYKITTVLLVPYCSPPLLAQTLLIYSAHRIYFSPRCGASRTGRVESFLFLSSPLFFFFTLALSICYVAVFSFSHSLLFPNPTSIGFSGVDSRESAVERGSGKKRRSLCSIMFACHWDKIDEMLCLASDLGPDSQMGVERNPCQN